MANFLGFGVHDRISEAMMWRWATDHPYLFTAIKITQPSIALIVIVAGIGIVRSMWRRS